MRQHILKRTFLLVYLVTLLHGLFSLVSAPQVFAIDTNDPQYTALESQIQQLQSKLSDAKKQEKTLQNQLDYIDNQTKLTELKIQEAQYEISKLDQEIGDLNGRMDKITTTVDDLTQTLLSRIVSTYKQGDIDPLNLLFSSKGFSDAIDNLKYIQVAQAYNQDQLYQLQATKSFYNDQRTDKQTRQAQQQQLEVEMKTYQTQLDDQKKQKQALLDETKGNEATYQKLLAQAEAQLAAFESFTGGNASILNNQTVCDDGWQGCYYNQRDSQWGNLPLNNTGYRIADIGCLMTSMAMVYTHYGHRDVTPISINTDSDNFASYAPTYLKYDISANGTSSSRVDIAKSIIDGQLSGKNPVVVGISYDGGPVADHFVVLISGSGGNYKMNDPFVPDGHNINFTDHYSLASIVEIDKVVF
ncbi:hypothetical protein M1563_02980 [Patescibacteria group bacterium]|nr:hypothetical protein [Patescibacteria group bacterium]